MILDLREFEDFPVRVRLVADSADRCNFSRDQVTVESLTLDLSVQRSEGEYFCQGSLTAEALLECARCLTRYQSTLVCDTDFIVRSGDLPEARGGEAIIDDEEYVQFQGNELSADIGELICQAVLLALPMHPLCNPKCRGLCSHCGAKLNDTDCGCRRDETDSRWDGLKSLGDLR